MKKIVYTFWHSESGLPAYLNLCMQTWKKMIPSMEVVVIDHSNWGKYVGDVYDLEKLKGFSLPMQSDAVSAAVLARRGGMFMDIDSIVTKDFFEDFWLLAPQKFVAFGKPNHKGMHIAVLKSQTPGNPIALRWMETCQERISNRADTFNWSYLGNDILNPLLNDEAFFDHYLIIDRSVYGNVLEATFMHEGNPQEDYRDFYFSRELQVDPLVAAQAARYGIISLHNSWTPSFYKDLISEAAVMNVDCMLSRLLAQVLGEEGRIGT